MVRHVPLGHVSGSLDYPPALTLPAVTNIRTVICVPHPHVAKLLRPLPCPITDTAYCSLDKGVAYTRGGGGTEKLIPRRLSFCVKHGAWKHIRQKAVQPATEALQSIRAWLLLAGPIPHCPCSSDAKQAVYRSAMRQQSILGASTQLHTRARTHTHHAR